MRARRLTVAFALTASVGAASVVTAPAASAQIGRLVLTVAPQAGGILTPGDGGTAKSVTLTCEPTGGTHPDADAACTDLIAADGDIARIPQAPAGCAGVWLPVIDSADGFWNGRHIHYSQEFSNAGCGKVQTGGHVFNFNTRP